MALWSGNRERRLWCWALALGVAIYSTLGLAGTLTQVLSSRELLDEAYVSGLLLAVVATISSTARRRPGKREIWVALSLIAAYGMVGVRMGIGPEERTHLFEYGLVALLIHQALTERRERGRHVPIPAPLAIAATALVGWLDEGIQSLLPNRFYDLRDVGVNALAGLMAVVASVALTWLRRTIGNSQ